LTPSKTGIAFAQTSFTGAWAANEPLKAVAQAMIRTARLMSKRRS
jgi:hypothetical protein